MEEYELLAKQYRYEDGELYIRGARPGKKWTEPAGTIGSKGYKQVKFQGRTYQSHIVIWILHNKSRPKGEIDHEDGNKLNNRIENLLDRTHRENVLNVNTWQGKKKYDLPVNISRKRGKYRTRVWINCKRLERSFQTLEEAVAYRDKLLG